MQELSLIRESFETALIFYSKDQVDSAADILNDAYESFTKLINKEI